MAWFRVVALSLLAALAAARPSLAADKVAVDVEIVFLADASNSIDHAEIRFQRQGYANAITHPDVLSAIAKGGLQRIAVTFIEWGDTMHQMTVAEWTLVKDLASARVFADRLMRAPRLAYGSNAIGDALAAGHQAIATNAFEGHRKVIDFSGDSANNWSGRPIADARKAALEAGLIINGLAIACREIDCSGRPVGYDLEAAFASRIIGGPGSFVITVDSANSFADAVRRKLILELAGLTAPRRAPPGSSLSPVLGRS
jgi:hypothetical protein